MTKKKFNLLFFLPVAYVPSDIFVLQTWENQEYLQIRYRLVYSILLNNAFFIKQLDE